jgi:hypothetical protein
VSFLAVTRCLREAFALRLLAFLRCRIASAAGFGRKLAVAPAQSHGGLPAGRSTSTIAAADCRGGKEYSPQGAWMGSTKHDDVWGGLLANA